MHHASNHKQIKAFCEKWIGIDLYAILSNLKFQHTSFSNPFPEIQTEYLQKSAM